MQSGLRVLQGTEVVQVMTAERRATTDRKYPLWPHGIVLALGCSLLCWVGLFAVVWLVWR